METSDNSEFGAKLPEDAEVVAASPKDEPPLELADEPVVTPAGGGGLPRSSVSETPVVADAGKPHKSAGRHFRDFAWEVVKIFAIVLILRAYVVQASTVDGQSMEPNLHDKDYLLVERLTVSLSGLPDFLLEILPENWRPKIRRGDLVVLASPENSNNELVKRVVAVEGDRLFFSGGRVYVNGEPLKEEYLPAEWLEDQMGTNHMGEVRHYYESDVVSMPHQYVVSTDQLDRATTPEQRLKLGVEIPKGCIFVLGDNRRSSKDSRAWTRTRVSSDSPGRSSDGTNHLWATVRSVHGRVFMRLRLPWDYDDQNPVFPR